MATLKWADREGLLEESARTLKEVRMSPLGIWENIPDRGNSWNKVLRDCA